MPRFNHTTVANSRRDERGLCRHTLRVYAQDLRTIARFSEVHHLSDRLSTDDILASYRHLRDELDARPATIERRLVTFRAYYAWREERNSALPSPFADVRISVRTPRRLPRPIDRDTLRAVLHAGERGISAQSARGADNAAPTSQDAVALLNIKLLIVTGVRISELTNVKVRDVSPDGGQILVRSKGDKERIVFVSNRKLQEQFRHFCQMRSEQDSTASPLFVNTVGRRIRATTFRKRLRALSKRLGIEPHLTPHRFRHSAATLLIEEGIDIRMVQALLGHADIKTTRASLEPCAATSVGAGRCAERTLAVTALSGLPLIDRNAAAAARLPVVPCIGITNRLL